MPPAIQKLIFALQLTAGLYGLFSSHSSWAQQEPMIFHTPAAEIDRDLRRVYSTQLLRMALDKTIEEYGPYELKMVDGLSTLRMQQVATANTYNNFFFKASYTDELAKHFNYAAYPIEFGIVGYRACFVAPDFLKQSNTVTSLQQLKQYSVGQGVGWIDVDVLKHNQIETVTVSRYSSLFAMINKKRFDFLCRGINEVQLEIEQFKDTAELTLNDSFLLHYPLPRFFFTNKQNLYGMKRVEDGLDIAFNDGSAKALFYSVYRSKIAAVELKNRSVIKLTNPLIQNINTGYEQYLLSKDQLSE